LGCLSLSELFCKFTEKENAIIWEKSLPEVVSSQVHTVAAWKDKPESEAMQGGSFTDLNFDCIAY